MDCLYKRMIKIMKIDLENTHSPCSQCYIRGILYSPDNELCQRCEYNISAYLLKRMLRMYDYCTFCKNRDHLGGGYWECKIDGNDCGECNIDTDFVIDWEEVFKEYG